MENVWKISDSEYDKLGHDLFVQNLVILLTIAIIVTIVGIVLFYWREKNDPTRVPRNPKRK